MHNERGETRRGRVLWFGGARITHRDGTLESKRVLVLDFEDTESLQVAVNSGFAELDMADDTVAVVLDSKPKPEG